MSGMRRRIEASFNAQALMGTLGAQLVHVEDGEVHILLPFDTRLTQQHGYLHAGAITSVVDSACGYAALTKAPEDHEVVTVSSRSTSFGQRSASDFSRLAKFAQREESSQSAPARFIVAQTINAPSLPSCKRQS